MAPSLDSLHRVSVKRIWNSIFILHNPIKNVDASSNRSVPWSLKAKTGILKVWHPLGPLSDILHLIFEEKQDSSVCMYLKYIIMILIYLSGKVLTFGGFIVFASAQEVKVQGVVYPKHCHH